MVFLGGELQGELRKGVGDAVFELVIASVLPCGPIFRIAGTGRSKAAGPDTNPALCFPDGLLMGADASPVQVDLAREADFPLGALLVRPSIRQVVAGAESETLEPRIMQVLIALARRRGEVVSRDELIAACWEGRIVGDGAVHRCVSLIRKLGEARDAFQIETIPRVGYRMLPAGGAIAPEDSREPAGEAGDPPSLAVLPFTNRSDRPEDDVFAAGMVEDVIAALSQAIFIRVLSSVATAGLHKGSFSDLAAVGRHLGVRYLLEGNVRRTGDNLRVATQLVEAATGAVVWSGRFERPLSELAALQEELVVEVAGCLDSQVQLLEARRALKKPGDLTAWEAVVRSTAAYREPGGAGLLRALEEAHRAVTIAPDYAAAQAQLAAASALLYFWTVPDNPAEVQRIRAIADKALALAPDDAFVLMGAGGALTALGFAQDALHPLHRALRKAPVIPVYFSLGWTYCVLDRPEEALLHLEAGARLTPTPILASHIKVLQANALIRSRRWKEAEAVYDEILALSPDYDIARLQKAALVWLGQRHDEAHALFAPLPGRGVELAQTETWLRRYYINSHAMDDILTAVRALWAKTIPSA